MPIAHISADWLLIFCPGYLLIIYGAMYCFVPLVVPTDMI